jgi:predicted metal-dependent HD superfamily phosphohydrolase
MTAPEAELRIAWQHLAGGAHDELLDRVLACHREPHRRYHTATHVMWVLRHLSRLAGATGEPIDVPALQLAALYHDIVYDARATDNEARSAHLAVAAARELGWDDGRVELVHRLVMATAGHRADDTNEALLVDADLAILGADPGNYDAYVRGVRAEYGHVTDDAWRAGRGAVLRGFLALPHLFNTATMRAEREARARANIAAELAALDAR